MKIFFCIPGAVVNGLNLGSYIYSPAWIDGELVPLPYEWAGAGYNKESTPQPTSANGSGRASLR